MDEVHHHRRRIEIGLERLVERNRVTIALVFPVVGAALLLASAQGWLPDPITFNPWLILFGLAVMRLPLIVGLLPAFDRRAVGFIGLLAGYAYAIESIGISTGWPYGEFVYGVALGPLIRGVPVALPVFFVPLVLNAVLFVHRTLPETARTAHRRVPIAIGVVLVIDLVLDPAAVGLGFWHYEATGVFYGVPMSNYAGWLLSATIGVILVEAAFSPAVLRERLDRCVYLLDDMVSFVLLWGIINIALQQWIPAGLAILLGGFLLSKQAVFASVGQASS